MTRLTTAIWCFGLSGFFAWISGSASSAALNARAHATQSGLILMMRQPVPDNGLAEFAMFASVLMLIIGIGYLIASMLPQQKRDYEAMRDNSCPDPESKREADTTQLTLSEARRRQGERMRRWAEEFKSARAAGKQRPLLSIPRPISTPVSSLNSDHSKAPTSPDSETGTAPDQL